MFLASDRYRMDLRNNTEQLTELVLKVEWIFSMCPTIDFQMFMQLTGTEG